jgi:hypothetical protein
MALEFYASMPQPIPRANVIAAITALRQATP